MHRPLALVGQGLVGLVIAALLRLRTSRPLVALARRCTASQRANFGIYLPEWLTSCNKAGHLLGHDGRGAGVPGLAVGGVGEMLE